MQFDAMVILAVLFLIFVTILYSPIFFILRKKGKTALRQLGYLLFLWSFLLILFMTLMPTGSISGNFYLNLRPFLWLMPENFSMAELVESIANVLMFIPLGTLVPIIFKKLRKCHLTIGTIFMLSFSIEFIQYFMRRVSDIDDLIANVLGGLIGYGIFKIFDHFFHSQDWWHKVLGLNTNN